MSKIFPPLIWILLLFFVSTGCSSGQVGQSSQMPGVSSPTAKGFAAGVWLAQSPDMAVYYFFDADGLSGRTASLENGMGVGFTYALDGENLVFHMGAADNETRATASFVDKKNAKLTWGDGRAETMRFVSEQTSETFQFYSNWELCQMAAAYYTKQTGGLAPDAAADLEPGLVTIQLYYNRGDHNTTCAWYRVHRTSAKGMDVNSGMEIDLTAVMDETVEQGQ